MIKISVIVPVYNTYAYLERCVVSLINQTINGIEIVLIDDGSTDGSSDLCDKLKEKYTNVIVVHKKNGGLSSARNEGIKNARGQYIGFLDSDDYVDNDMYEKLADLLDGSDSMAIACANFRKVFDDGKIEERHSLFNAVAAQTREEYFRDLLLHKGDVSVCTKLFPRALIQNSIFEENKLNEDLLYIVNLDFQTVIFLGETKYNYFVRSNSITNTFSKAFLVMGENSIVVRDKIFKDYPSLIEAADRFAIVQNLYLVLKFPRKIRKGNLAFDKARSYILENYKKAIINQYLTKKEKLYIKGIKYFNNIFLFLYHIFR